MDRLRKRILFAAERGSKSLLFLYPRSFREEYGAEIRRSFSDLARERYDQAGVRGLLCLAPRILGDTFVSAVREHRDTLSAGRGDPSQTREVLRGPPSTFASWAHDLRYALRFLTRQPAFTLVVVLILALGIGANTAIFSVMYGALLRPLPYEDGERLVHLRHLLPDREWHLFSLSELDALRESSSTLAQVEEYHSMSFILLGEGSPERVMTGVVSTGFFDLLGIEPLAGRTFQEDDNGRRVLLLSHDYWTERLERDPGVIGRTVEMNDHSHTIVGILPPLPAFPGVADVFMPRTSCPFRQRHLERGDQNDRVTFLLARLVPEVSVEEATVEVERVVKEANDGHRRDAEWTSGGVRLIPVTELLARDARPTFLVLYAAVVFLLLIVCANAANLTLARLVRRERELAVRTALGAGRVRLMRQLMAENLLLAGLAGVVGLVLAGKALGRLADFASRFTVRADEIRLDGAALLFTLAVVCLMGVALGTLPIFPRYLRLAQALKAGSWGRFLGHGRQRLQRLLVIVQLAVSVVLLVGAGLMIRSLMKLQDVDPGFRADDVLTMTLDLNWSRYQSPEEYRRFFTRLLDELSDHPEIESVAVAETFPFHDFSPEEGRLWVEGQARGSKEPAPRVDLRVISEEYFETLGIELLHGRGFSCRDNITAAQVVVVNRSLSRHFFGTEDPVGRRISVDEGKSWMTIVGVVDDVKQYGLASEVRDEVYAPLRQHVSRVMTLVARTRADPQRISREMWHTVSEIDSQQAIAHLRTLEQIRQDTLAPPRLTTALLGLFALVALVLAAAGVSGVLGFFVSQRTHEIGVRMALGAGRRTVLRMVLVEGMGLAVIGLAVGLGGAYFFSRSMTGLLFEVEPSDPGTFFAVTLLLLGVAAFACFVPARWATLVEPVEALRQE